MSQHLLQTLRPTCQYQLFTGAGPAPPGCSLVWSHRHPHVAALPRIKCHEREHDLAPSSGTEKSQPSCPKAGASHLKRVVKLAGLDERVPIVSVLSHIFNRGLGRPWPPRPCRGSGGGSQRPLRSSRSAPLRCAPIGYTDRKGHKDPRSSCGLRLRPEGKAGSAPT